MMRKKHMFPCWRCSPLLGETRFRPVSFHLRYYRMSAPFVFFADPPGFRQK